jgi:soluble lytic murein transglycosylase
MKRLLPARLWVFLILLVFILQMMNLSAVWKWMYPIYYPEEIKKASEKYNINPYLILAIIQTESKFLHQNTSKKGAIGLMQLMRQTADWIIEKGGYSDDTERSIHEPAVNIELGSWYLRYLIDLFDGNLVAAIAAYNAGQGNVYRWLTTGIWDGSMDQVDRIPYGETRHYIQRVIYVYEQYEKIYGNESW